MTQSDLINAFQFQLLNDENLYKFIMELLELNPEFKGDVIAFYESRKKKLEDAYNKLWE